MFGSGPSEEIRLESKTVEQTPPDEHESQARYEEHLDHEQHSADGASHPSLIERLKRWFSARF